MTKDESESVTLVSETDDVRLKTVEKLETDKTLNGDDPQLQLDEKKTSETDLKKTLNQQVLTINDLDKVKEMKDDKQPEKNENNLKDPQDNDEDKNPGQKVEEVDKKLEIVENKPAVTEKDVENEKKSDKKVTLDTLLELKEKEITEENNESPNNEKLINAGINKNDEKEDGPKKEIEKLPGTEVPVKNNQTEKKASFNHEENENKQQETNKEQKVEEIKEKISDEISKKSTTCENTLEPSISLEMEVVNVTKDKTIPKNDEPQINAKLSEKKIEETNFEVGIVGEPTAVTELINDDELGTESNLPTEGHDHVAQWVENSSKLDGKFSISDEEIEPIEKLPKIKVKQRQNVRLENNSRKRRKIVNHIIKRSIKCLNKMHAMDESGAKKLESAEMKKDEDDFSRKSPQVPQSQQNGAALPEETAAAAADRLHSAVVKEEPFMESVTDTAKNSTTDSAISKKSEGIRSRKRRSTEETISTNGNSVMKKVCVEQRDQLVSSLITGYENASADELATRADVLRAELQALDELARAAEMEWNRVLTMRKLKEEAFLRIERRRQVINFMEGHDRLSDMLPPSNLILEGDLEGRKMEMRQGNAIMKDKSGFSSRDEHGDNSVSQDIGLFKNDKKSNLVQNFANRNLAEAKKQAEALAENRQIGEGRQGPIVDVRSIIADYRLRHPETVPRRGRRMRNSVNIGLGAGGAMVETGQNVDSRPSSTDSCKSNSNTDTNNSMSFKDVLVQFAKLSQQQGEAVKTPQNYPDVTLHPVAPSPTQTPTPQQTGSLLHGILTKAQSPRPTTFSPTLARLLTAPERERNIPVPTTMAPTTTPTTNVMPHTNSRSQRLLQTYQETNPVSISDLLSSSKGRTEITITPVVNPSVQSHVNNMMHVDDDEETSLMEERESRISGGNRDDRDISPRCQGCHERAAQYVCAGCGNQWYCSPECQAAAWDEHSEVCSG